MNPTAELRTALQGCLNAMEMQEGRMNETMHIPSHTAADIWNEAKERAKAVLDRELKCSTGS